MYDSKTPPSKNESRSRSCKTKRQLNNVSCMVGQTRITNYFDILNAIQMLIARNKFLQTSVQNLVQTVKSYSFQSSNALDRESVLKLMFDSAMKHSSRHKNGYRHDDTTKMFAAYIRILGGRLLYETIYANLPSSIPSPSTISLYISDKGAKITEGALRSDELLTYLENRKLPLVVSLSEDITRMVGKICYDPKSNKLVGFSLPLNDDGMPTTELFLARKMFQKSKIIFATEITVFRQWRTQ